MHVNILYKKNLSIPPVFAQGTKGGGLAKRGQTEEDE